MLTIKARPLGQAVMGLASLVVLLLAMWAILGPRAPDGVVSGAEAANGQEAQIGSKLGPSGLPVPRFVSLKNDSTNVRRGPSSDHGVLFVYKSKGVPVEIVAESEHWRRIRDSAGEEGWVYKSLLSGERTVLVIPGKTGLTVMMKKKADGAATDVAKLEAGVMARVEGCDGTWCEVIAGDYDGFVPQNTLFGVYPGERFGD